MERESLKEINEELRCSQAQQHQLSQAGAQRIIQVFALAVIIKTPNIMPPNGAS